MNIIDFEKQNMITIVNTSPMNNIDLYVESYGYERCTITKPPFFSSSNSNHSFFFIKNGCALFTKDNNTVRLRKNTCFILDPTENISYQPDKTNPCCTYWVSFSGRKAKNVLKKSGMNLDRMYMHLSTNIAKEVRSLFFSAFNEPSNLNAINDFYFTSRFYDILKHVFECSQEKEPSKNNVGYVENAIDFINQHYTESDFSIARVANELHLHKNYFSTIFKEQTGVSFNAYLTQRRMVLAVSLIRQGCFSITKIAEAVGIPDPSYFSKVFKQYNKIPPTIEIKRMKEKQKTGKNM